MVVYFSSIDKDIRRIIGKRLCRSIEEYNGGWLCSERSNGDMEYKLNRKAGYKVYEYIMNHRRSRLARACVDYGEYDGFFKFRFEGKHG